MGADNAGGGHVRVGDPPTDPLPFHCVVPGCTNDVVRVLRHKADGRVTMGLCAHHVRRAILYLPDDQVRDLVLGPTGP